MPADIHPKYAAIANEESRASAASINRRAAAGLPPYSARSPSSYSAYATAELVRTADTASGGRSRCRSRAIAAVALSVSA